nr:hypothetical protein [Tanacetum cinerariifolium]
MNETDGLGGVEGLTWIFSGLSLTSSSFSSVLDGLGLNRWVETGKVGLKNCFGNFKVALEQDKLPSCVGLDFRARLDGGFFGVSVTKLTTGRLIDGSSCDGIDMVIKDLDLEPKVDAMMRDFLLITTASLYACDAVSSHCLQKVIVRFGVGTSKSQPKSTNKFAQAEETVVEAGDTQEPHNQGQDMGNTDDQPNVKAVPKHDWFKKPERPPTPDRIGMLEYQLTLGHLKWTCKRRVELEYNIEESYKAVTDRLDLNNPQGKEYPFNLSNLLSLITERGRQVILVDYFINNDLEYLGGGSLSKKYTSSATKTKDAKYDIPGTEDMVPLLWTPIKEIEVQREDLQLYKFKEGDFPRLHLHDIEDILLLFVQKKLYTFERVVIFDLGVALRMLTRRIVILKRVEDLQLGVERYQKKLKITKPKTFKFDISNKLHTLRTTTLKELSMKTSTKETCAMVGVSVVGEAITGVVSGMVVGILPNKITRPAVKIKDYEYYKTKMLVAKKEKDEQVLLAKDHAWMESSSDSDQEINTNMVFTAQIEKVLFDSEASSLSVGDKISKVSYYLSESESESEYETLKYYDNTTTYDLFVNDNDDQEIFHDCENFPENLIESQINHNESTVDHNDSKGIDKLIRKFNKKIAKCLKRIKKANQENKDFENQNKDLQDKYDVLKNQATTFEMKNKEL